MVRPWIAFAGGIVCTLVVWTVVSPSAISLVVQDFSGCNVRFNLLNPRRRCLPEPRVPKREYEEFQQVLKERVQQLKTEGVVDHISVYFRDLDNGPWFGIDESEEFFPASLLKIPIMMTLLRYAEEHPGFLDQTITYTGTFDDVENNAAPTERIEANRTYTIGEVLRYMVAYSDNRSKQVILQTLLEVGEGRDLLAEMLTELGILPGNGDLASPITIKTYTSLFRILYNNSYLNREYSQKALDMLSQSTFTLAMVAGLPPRTQVAHKFGLATTDDGVQLHDCGIVYEPGTPYLLCIMTRGKDAAASAKVIAEISRAVNDEVRAHAE